MAKFIDAAGLQRFKANQDAANLNKFVALDENGVARADQLPSYVDDVIDVHVETVAGATTFYADNIGVKGNAISAGERSKIYIDVDNGAQYRWSGSQFVQIGASLSTADRAVNDADGNSITATYATKAELTALAGTIPTTALTVGGRFKSGGTAGVIRDVFASQALSPRRNVKIKKFFVVDGTGVILADKLPLNFGADVIAIHVVTMNNRTKFYRDKVDANGNHTTCPAEVQGEVGKIYIDLESGSKDHYVYDAASGEFMLLSPEIATEADINAMF